MLVFLLWKFHSFRKSLIPVAFVGFVGRNMMFVLTIFNQCTVHYLWTSCFRSALSITHDLEAIYAEKNKKRCRK